MIGEVSQNVNEMSWTNFFGIRNGHCGFVTNKAFKYSTLALLF